MAQKVNVVLIDDIDGSMATQTVNFALDGTAYEIDLNDANAVALREFLAGFIGFARRTGASKKGRRATVTSIGPSTKQVRDWARSNGYTVSDRGRVSADIREAFDAAH